MSGPRSTHPPAPTINQNAQNLWHNWPSFVGARTTQVLASTTVSYASQVPGEVAFLRDLVAGLVPSGSRPSTAETFLPCAPREAVGGGAAAAATKAPPRRVALCALPEECSRHNSPAQPHAVADCVRAISGSGSVAVVMCLDNPSYAFAAGWYASESRGVCTFF